MLTHKIVVTLSAGVLFGSLMYGVVPTAGLGPERALAAPAAPLANQQLRDQINRIRSVMTADELNNIKQARAKIDELKQNPAANQALVKEIWAKIDKKIKDEKNKGNNQDFSALTQENIFYLTLQLGFQYDSEGKAINEVITDSKNRTIANQLIILGGQSGGLNDVDLNDVYLFINKGETNVINRFRSMTMSELLKLVNNKADADRIVKEELDRVISDPGLKFSQVLSTIGIGADEIVQVFKNFLPRVDPDRKALLSWAAATIRADGLGQGRRDDSSGGDGGSAGSPSTIPGTPAPTATYITDKGYVTAEVIRTEKVTVNGQSTTKVSLAGDKLKSAIDTLLSTNFSTKTLTIDVGGTEQTLRVEIPAASLSSAIKSDVVISVKTGGITFNLPISVLGQLNLTDPGSNIVINISKVTGAVADQVNQSLNQSGATALLPAPIEFSISIEGPNGSKTVLHSYNGIYLERSITLPGRVDTDHSAGVWLDPVTNQLRSVPTIFSLQSDGSTVAIVKSPHDSVYTIIKSNNTFTDVAGHWAQKDIEIVASKLIVDGVSENSFAPDASLTRAQFSALLVRSLGLAEEKYSARFKDVAADDWFSGTLEAAVKAGLIDGYEDGTFRPNDAIQREQLAVLVNRSLKFANGQARKVSSLSLDSFADKEAVSTWAADSVQLSLQTGLLNGMSDSSFAPKQKTTRAQGAVLLKRLLSYLNFMN